VADVQVTRERLLEAAESLFASRGFAATSVREITAAARCNVAAVNYYFAGKLGLYEALFRSRLAGLRRQRVESVRQAMARARGAARLTQVLRAFADAFLEPLVAEGRGRHLIGLLSRELLDPHLPPALFQGEMVQPVQRSLVDALVRLRPDLSREQAARCVVSIIGQLVQVAHRCHWAAAAERRKRERLPSLTTMAEHIARFSAGGVLACAKGNR
jgi:AcrR family transcriptional regulator